MPVKKKTTPVSAAKKPQTVKEVPTKHTLIPVSDLLSDAWNLYKTTFFSYLKVVGAGILLVIAGLLVGVILAIPLFISSGGSAETVFTHPSPQQIAGMVLVVIWLIAYIVVLTWYSLLAPIAYLHIISSPKKQSLRQLYTSSKPYVWPVFLAGLLGSLYVLGGLGLLVIPALVFGMFFTFVTNVIVFENLRGLDALKRSYQLVRSHFWGIVLRIVLVEVVVYVSSNILDGLANQTKDFNIFKLLSPLYSVVVEWFVVCFMYLLYKQLADVKGSLPSLRTVTILAIAGGVILVALILFLAITNPSTSGGPLV